MNWAEATFSFVAITAWVFGIAVAKGWWILAAVLVPPVAWVLLAQRFLE